MKKSIILFAIAASAFVSAQEIVQTSNGKSVKLNADKTWEYIEVKTDDVLTKQDFVFNEKGVAVVNRKIQMKDGKNNLVNVDIMALFKKEDIEIYNFSKFKQMIDRAGLEAQYSLKNKVTFLPLKINILRMDNQWSYMIDYAGQNDYGATKDSSSIVFFDNDGNFVKKL